MPEWNINPETIKYMQRGNSIVYQNMLYVPLEELIELPGVTITIGEEFPNEEQALKNVEQRYRYKKSTLYKRRQNYIRSVQTSLEKREERQAVADGVMEITTQDDALQFLNGWSKETIEAIMPVFF